MYILRSGGEGYLLLIYRYTPVCNNSGEFTRLSSAAESQLAGDPLAGRTVCLCVKSTRHPWRCTPTSGWGTLSSWTRSIWSNLSRTSRSGESSCTDCPQVVSHYSVEFAYINNVLYSMPQCRSFLVLYCILLTPSLFPHCKIVCNMHIS